jgi:hypothetical protein
LEEEEHTSVGWMSLPTGRALKRFALDYEVRTA